MSSEPTASNTLPPTWRRLRVWTVVCLLYGIVLALAVAGFLVLRHAFTPGLDVSERLYRLFGATALLAFPALVAFYLTRIKWTTGRWTYPREQTLQRMAQCAMHPQRRVRPQQRSLVLFVLHWANIALRAPESSIWKRLLGALTLIVYAAVLLAIIALSILFIGAGIGTLASLGWIMILFGLILLVIPAQFIAGIVHRYRTHGNLRSSTDDLSAITAARNVWFAQQRQQPLRAKLVSSAIIIAVLTVLWLRVTVYHSRHPHESWTLPFLWTLVALYLIWNQFRRPRNSTAK